MELFGSGSEPVALAAGVAAGAVFEAFVFAVLAVVLVVVLVAGEEHAADKAPSASSATGRAALFIVLFFSWMEVESAGRARLGSGPRREPGEKPAPCFEAEAQGVYVRTRA